MPYGPFSDSDIAAIKHAISQAELRTSGELRVHIEKRCPEEVLDRAAHVFEELEMHKTKDRSGVLIYLSYDDRKTAILGDAGINQKVGDHFWDEIRNKLVSHFKEQRFTQGLCEALADAGEKLKQHFPHAQDDVDELSNEVSFGSNKD